MTASSCRPPSPRGLLRQRPSPCGVNPLQRAHRWCPAHGVRAAPRGGRLRVPAGGSAQVVVQVVAQQVLARNKPLVDRVEHTVDAATDLDGGAACARSRISEPPRRRVKHRPRRPAVRAPAYARRPGGHGHVSPGPAWRGDRPPGATSPPALPGRGLASTVGTRRARQEGPGPPRSGSCPTRTACTNRVSGTARTAPIGPRTTVHTMTDRKERVTDRPTASPTNTGWMTDWRTKLASE